MRTADGLTSTQAAELLQRTGPNLLPAEKPVPQWRKLWGEMTHFFALMLWCAAVLAYVADMPQLAVAIVVVVIVNGVFAHIQQERAQHAAARLRGLLPADVVVRRDGRVRTVHASELVTGDVVLLAAGDRVPADAVLDTASACTVDESMLTGESELVPKKAGDAAWGGTFLVNGEGEAVVTATGARTRLAGIAALTSQAAPPPTPLSLELRRIVRVIAGVALAIAALFFTTSLLVGFQWRDAFLFAIGVAVALVPEGLLPTVTLSLAMGAQRMASRKALVRNLEAVETLGSTTFICTDKTGTLTQNRMNAVEVLTTAGRVQLAGEGYQPEAAVEGEGIDRAAEAALAALAASQGGAEFRDGQWRAQGDPMEAAIDVLARRLTGRTAQRETPSRRIAFDPARRRETAVIGTDAYCKGAPEAVFPLCRDVPALLRDEVTGMASRGLRVIAVARRRLDADDPAAGRWESCPADLIERHMELLGLVGLHDPPRTDAAEVIQAARRAGLKLGMITGDHPETAAAIGPRNRPDRVTGVRAGRRRPSRRRTDARCTAGPGRGGGEQGVPGTETPRGQGIAVQGPRGGHDGRRRQ